MYIALTILGIICLYFDKKKTNDLALVLAYTFIFTGIVSYKFPQNYIYLFVSFPAFFLLFKILICSVLKKEQIDKIKKENLSKDFIGKKAIVVKDIGKRFSIDGLGYIKFENEIWQAKNITDKKIKAGMRVKIVSCENKIMNVKVLDNA